MPPPFVYLIPEDYFGPVFVLFGQPDGAEMQPDPLGHAINVPESGIVKIKAPRPQVMGVTEEGRRATYFILVSKAGQRKNINTLTDVYRDEDGIWWQGIVDEATTLHKYVIGKETTGNFDHLPKTSMNERMIAGRRNCRFRFENADEASKGTHCDQFLVASPNERMSMPDWMWEDTGTYVESIADFLARAHEIHEKKLAHYGEPRL